MVLNQGAYPLTTLSSVSLMNVMRTMLPSVYRIYDFSFSGTVVYSNKASYVAYRAPWEMETWARERMLDRIGRELGIDAIEIRRRNLLSDDELPRKMVTAHALRHHGQERP